MGRYDHPAYRNSPERARTARQPATGEPVGTDPTSVGADGQSTCSTAIAIILGIVGVILTMGLLP